MEEMTIAKYIRQCGLTGSSVDSNKDNISKKEKFVNDSITLKKNMQFLLSDDFKEVAMLVGQVKLLKSREKKNDDRCIDLMYENTELKAKLKFLEEKKSFL